MKLPKYHIYLEYDKTEAKTAIRFNLTEEELVRTFVWPLQTGKSFWFCGKLLLPEKVDHVVIFLSEADAGELVLPNREMVAGHPNKKFVMEKIRASKVRGVAICTERFLPAGNATTSAEKQ